MSKLFRKTLLAIVILFGIVANATALLSAWILYNNLTEEYVTKGRAIAKSIAGASVEVLLNRDASTVQATIDEFLEIEGVAYVYVRDDKGEIISHTFTPCVPKELESSKGGRGVVTVENVALAGHGEYIQVSAPILAGVAGRVYVGMDKDIIWQKMRAAILQQELLMLGMFCLSVVVFYILIKGVSRPLTELSEYARRLKNHDFSATIEVRSGDEVGLLAGTMKSMAGELSTLVTGLEKAVANSTAELQETLAYLRAIIENLADGLLVIDNGGRISNYNPALAAMFGLEGHDLTGKDSRQAFSGNMVELAEKARSATKGVLTAEVRLSGGGVGKAVATAIHLHSPEEQPVCMGAVVLVRDITAEKQVDQMKTEFISTVSHELRTPLTSVLGFAKIIRKKFGDDISPNLAPDNPKAERAVRQIRDNLGIIVSEGERLTELVNDVLDIAKMESGKVEWDMRQASIPEIIERSASSTASLIENKRLRLVLDIEPDLPGIHGDRDRLIQVMLNLISNAVKFTDHGSITIRAMRRGEGVIVGVADTGPGIHAKDQELIFEKFKQSGDTLTEKPKGTGLGLPICKQIVERHGGDIWVESRLGHGSVFWFTLPLAPPMEPALECQPLDAGQRAETQTKIEMVEGAAARFAAKKPLILVVDDESPVRAYLRALFSDEGFEVLVAADGPEALVMAAQHRPDLITMDLMMPGMDGGTVIGRLRADARTKDIPVIVISALPAREREKAGADASMDKPVDEAALIETVNVLLHGAGAVSRPCMVLRVNGERAQSPLFMLCPGEVSYASRDEVWLRLDEGFSGTVFVPASISHVMDLARLSANRNIHVVILPD